MSKTLQQIKAIFPQFDSEVIESVLASNDYNQEKTINALLVMSGEHTGEEQQLVEDVEQVSNDEIYARQLAIQEEALIPMEDPEESVINKEDFNQFKESVKTGFNKGVSNFKTFVNKFVNNNGEASPRVEYSSLPRNEFDEFLNDDNLDIQEPFGEPKRNVGKQRANNE